MENEARPDWLARLAELGIELPPVATPVASYVPATRVGNQVWTSGQLPFVDGKLPVTGQPGKEVSIADAVTCARAAALNALAAIDELVGLNSIVRILKVTGYVSSAEGFHDQPVVVNGASDVIGEIFGVAGKHVRSAVGVAELPLDSPVEVEIVAEIHP